MSKPSAIRFTAWGFCARAALVLVHSGCAHGVEPAASSEALDTGVSHADGSAGSAGVSRGSSGSAGSPVTISGGAAGVGGAGGDLVDANAGDVAPEDATSTSIDAPIDSKDAARTVDATPEAGCPNPTACALRSALVHRYSFGGANTVVTDSIGTAHGTVINATLTGAGSLTLAGGTTDQYVDLPNNIISTLTNATFEVWITWSGGGNWQRIFDFGNADSNMENVRAAGASTLHMTPLADGAKVLRFAFKRTNQTVAQETDLEATMPLASGALVHVAGVIDDANNMMYLYRDGAPQGSKAFADSLSMLTDVNNWLGRSQYASDPSLGATLHEFRIYNAALSAAQVQASFAAGQNPAYLAK